MAPTAADVLIEAIQDRGVEVVFGLPGDGINGIILAGRGALHATDELEQTAVRLAAPIVKALLGKAAVPDDSPYTTGSIGLLGTKPSQEALEECDTLLIVGSSFPYIEFLPKPGQARGVQIELDLRRKTEREFLESAQERMKDWLELV
jgi:pyruvate dehydrogenase (quinone)/pyruvate oxidase